VKGVWYGCFCDLGKIVRMLVMTVNDGGRKLADVGEHALYTNGGNIEMGRRTATWPPACVVFLAGVFGKMGEATNSVLDSILKS
jgi:hypothetical protein